MNFNMHNRLNIDIYQYLSNEELTQVQIGIAAVPPYKGIGGCRIMNYITEESAEQDLISLVASMQNKSCFHQLNLAGAKCIANINSISIKNRKSFFYELGKKIEFLGGKYIVAMDSGTGQEDMNCIKKFTNHVTNHDEVGGSPSVYTAEGVFSSIRELSAKILKKLPEDTQVSIQGIGNVGIELLKKLIDNNYKVVVTDSNQNLLRNLHNIYPNVKIVEPDSIYSIECDIFSPCALGGVINKETVKMLRCKIICGAANSQLSSIAVASELKNRNIIFIPDELVNAGGLLYCSYQYFKDKEMYNKISNISKMVSSFAEYCVLKNVLFNDAVQEIYNFPYYNRYNSVIANSIKI